MKSIKPSVFGLKTIGNFSLLVIFMTLLSFSMVSCGDEDDAPVGTDTIENGKMTYNCNYDEDVATFILTKIQ